MYVFRMGHAEGTDIFFNFPASLDSASKSVLLLLLSPLLAISVFAIAAAAAAAVDAYRYPPPPPPPCLLSPHWPFSVACFQAHSPSKNRQ